MTNFKSIEAINQSAETLSDSIESEFDPTKTAEELIQELSELSQEVLAHFGQDDGVIVAHTPLGEYEATRSVTKKRYPSVSFYNTHLEDPFGPQVREIPILADKLPIVYHFVEWWSEHKTKNTRYEKGGLITYRWQLGGAAVRVSAIFDTEDERPVIQDGETPKEPREYNHTITHMEKPEDILRLIQMVRRSYPEKYYSLGPKEFQWVVDPQE